MVIIESDSVTAVDVNGSDVHMSHASILGQYGKEGDI